MWENWGWCSIFFLIGKNINKSFMKLMFFMFVYKYSIKLFYKGWMCLFCIRGREKIWEKGGICGKNKVFFCKYKGVC